MTIDKKSSIVNQMWISGSNTKYLENFDKKVSDKNLRGGGSSGRGSECLTSGWQQNNAGAEFQSWEQPTTTNRREKLWANSPI